MLTGVLTEESILFSPFPFTENDDDDDVRAPIPQRQETMIEAGYEGYQIRSANPHRGRVRTVFDGFRNFNNETSE